MWPTSYWRASSTPRSWNGGYLTPTFEHRLWRVEPLVLIVSPDHALAEAGCIERDRLVDLPMLGGEPGSGTGRLLTEYFGELGVPRSGMQLGSTEAVKQAVRAGLGVSLVMASAVQDEVRSGALVALPIPGLEKRLQLIWRKPPGNLHPPGFVRHLLEEADLAG